MTPQAPLTTISTTLPSKEMEEVRNTTPSSFFPNILFIQGRMEDTHIFDDEPTVLGEEPPSVTHADAETGIEMCGVTMKLGNRIQHNPSPRMRPLK